MIVTRYHRHYPHRYYRRDEVTINMTLAEFRETVEWLEEADPRDGATKEWRRELDRIDPPDSEEE